MADLDKELGFEPIHDEDIGFQAVGDDAKALGNYMESDRPGPLDSLVAGAQQGATAGFAPRLEAAAKAGLERLSYGSDVSNPPSLSDLYNSYLDEKQKSFKSAEDAHPLASTVGNVAGAVATAPALGLENVEGLGAKTLQGAKAGAGYGAASAAGNEKDLNSPTLAKDMIEGAMTGADMGAAGSALFGGAVKGARKAKDAGAFLHDVLGGQVLGEMGAGFDEGLKGNELVSSEAPKRVGKEINDLSQKIVSGIKNELDERGAKKAQLIKMAQEAGIKIKPEEVDEFLKHVDTVQPKSNLEEVSADYQRLKNLVNDASQGKEEQVVKRQFYGDGPTDKQKFLNKMTLNEAAENASKADDFTPVSPRDDFETRAKQKEVEQKALAGTQDPTPHEITYEPLPNDPNHEMGIVRQPQYDENGQFSGYKKVMSEVLPTTSPEATKPEIVFQESGIPGQTVALRRVPIKNDAGETTGFKVLNKSLIKTEDAAKFKDFTETVRAGGKDLGNPEEMYQLYKDLKQRGQFGDYSFRTDEGKKAAGEATQQVQDMMRGAIPELHPLDTEISSLKGAADDIKMNTYDNPDETNVWKKVGKMITDAYGDTGIKSAEAESDLKHFINKIKVANPTLGAEIERKAAEIGNRARVTGAAQKDIYLPRPLSTARTAAAKAGNITGYGIYNASPEWMMNLGSQLKSAGSKAASSVGDIIAKAADKDQVTRNSIMFGLMQNPAYRQILKPYVPENSEMLEQQK